jgi:uncharacterized protein (DUF1800 family)
LLYLLFVCLSVTSAPLAAAPVITAVTPRNLVPGSSQTITVDGTGFVVGANIVVNGTPVTSNYVSPTRLTTTVSIQPSAGAVTVLTVTSAGEFSAPVLVNTEPLNPKVSYAAAVRFLEQATFGPDARSIARVQQLGFNGWLNEQFAMNKSTYPTTPDSTGTLINVQSRFFANAVSGEDQLRQRIAFALGNIFVISGYKTFSAQQVLPYLQLLHDKAFSDYKSLLRSVTLSPTMGLYLDMVNNVKANSYTGSVPNENFAREVLQLFTIGTELLNQDASVQRGADGRPLPAYTHDTVVNFARAFTGWTYAPLPGALPSISNPPNFGAPMQPSETRHDTGGKTLLRNTILIAGQTTTQDLEAALDNIYQHPNVAPFLAKRLIKALVTSNPSPAYVARVAGVFNSSLAGRGDLRSVIRAILLDGEARAGDPPATPSRDFGRLREPILYITSALRAVGTTVQPQNTLAGLGNRMDQMPLYPRSVFGFYSQNYTIAGTTLNGPEFEIFSPSTAVAHADFAQSLAFGSAIIGVTPNTTLLESLRGDPAAITSFMGRCYLRDQMSEAMKAPIQRAILALSTKYTLLRAETALFLTVASPFFQVQH